MVTAYSDNKELTEANYKDSGTISCWSTATPASRCPVSCAAAAPGAARWPITWRSLGAVIAALPPASRRRRMVTCDGAGKATASSRG
jgi:hypothetical protein